MEPRINNRETPIFSFQTELVKPYPFREANGFTEYKPAVKSTPFDVDGTCVYMQDDGLGNLMLVTDDITNPVVYKPIAGTIDYSTGLVKLNSIEVEAFDGSSIKVMVRAKSSEYKAPQGRVFIIRDEDVQVNMILDEKPASGTTSSSSAIGSLSGTSSSSSSSGY